MTTVLLIINLFVTIALIGVVLIQRSEGGGLGIGSSQGMGSFMSGRGTANLLTRTTAILATIFMALSLTLALMNRGTSGVGGGHSILDGGPPITSTAPLTAPPSHPSSSPAASGQTPAVPATVPGSAGGSATTGSATTGSATTGSATTGSAATQPHATGSAAPASNPPASTSPASTSPASTSPASTSPAAPAKPSGPSIPTN